MATTIKEIAAACGVSKATAARKAAELGIEGAPKAGDGRGTRVLTAKEASTLAAALTAGRGSRVADADPVTVAELAAAQVEPLKAAMAALERENERLQGRLTEQAEQSAQALAAARAEADEARRRAEAMADEVARLREELALARALEGFHWPWERRRILAGLLPSPSNV